MILKSIFFGCFLLADLHLVIGVALDGDCTTSECATDNAVCDGDKKCVCDGAYKKDDINCVAKGLADPCSADTDCDGVTNAECASSATCQCSNGYKANEASTCVLVYGMACSETVDCAGLKDSACTNDKCACAEGFEESNDICSPESGAVSLKSAVGLVFGSVILFLIQAL